MGGGLISRKGNGNGHRGRPYGLMLLLAFGAALVGVMALHKLRERRIFNLLVEEKNRQLISFQLLVQQNEIKLLRDKNMDSGDENPQVIALTATLKQKVAEIEDLNHRLKSSVRVRLVSSDDPSNPVVNITSMGSMEQKEKTEFSHEEGGRVHESLYKGRDNSTKGQDGNETKSIFSQEEDNREGVEDGSEKKGETTLKMGITEGQLQKLESLGENARNEEAGREMKNEYSKHIATSKIDEEKNHANATDTTYELDEQEKKSSFTAGQLEKLKNPHQEGESQKLQRTHGGGKNLEIDENSRISRLPGRFRHLISRTKGKRWRYLARNRFLRKKVNSEIDGGVETMRSTRFSKEYKDVVRSREEGAVSDEGKAEREETETGLRKEIDHTNANLFKHQNSEDTEDMKHRKMSAETNDQVEGDNAMSRNHDNSLARVVPENTGVNGEASKYTHDAKQLKVEEAANIKQNMNSRDVKELEKKAALNAADRDEVEDHMEVADKQEPETEAANGELSSDFMTDSEDKEGYKEETDESEF